MSIFDHTHQKLFKELLISMNLYQTVENQVSRDMVAGIYPSTLTTVRFVEED